LITVFILFNKAAQQSRPCFFAPIFVGFVHFFVKTKDFFVYLGKNSGRLTLFLLPRYGASR